MKESETYEFRLGDFRAVAVLDGTNNYKAASFFVNVPDVDVAEALERHGIDAPDRIPSTFTCLALLNTRRPADGWILLDTGNGTGVRTTGRLPRNLELAGIPLSAIKTVVITHAHPDHIGGIAATDGTTYYRNAQFVVPELEWNFWMSDEAVARQPKSRVDTARKQLGAVKDQVKLVALDAQIAPGIRFVDTHGHTPGHAVVEVASRGERLLFISDLALHQIHIEEPEWRNAYDLDAELADAARRRTMQDAASTGALVLAYHFVPFPSLGRVKTTGGGWEWVAAPPP
jgi:glyoxylase-like metal-dependent hydrolase (beta-lactamase superfamily II)